MTRNLKVLGLALVAALAMSAVVASAASAQFHSEKEETTLTVSDNDPQTFKYVGTSSVHITCTSITTDATIKGTESEDGSFTTTEATVGPHYTGCTGPLGTTAHVDFNSCDYQFTLEPGETTGTSHIECVEPEDSITVTVTGLCQLHIPEQTDLEGTIHFGNKGSGTTREVSIEPTVTGINATRTGSALCGAASSTTGTYSGAVTVTGEEKGVEGDHVGIWVS